MSLPLDILHRRPDEAARRIALGFLDEARAACERLGDPRDEEALHDFRVAVRRLRSTLRAWRRALKGSVAKKHLRALRSLQRATGTGRDAEVALDWLTAQSGSLRGVHRRGYEWLTRHLGERLDASRLQVRDEVRESFAAIEDALRSRLGSMSIEVRLDGPSVHERFGDALAAAARTHARELVEQLARVSSIDDEDAMHAARIRGKRLRYLAEPVAGHLVEARTVVKHCKRLQDVLGDLNDTRVLRGEAGAAIQKAAADHARRLQERTREDDPDLSRHGARRSERSGLLEISRRLRRRQHELFARLRRGWLEDGGGALAAAVERLARRAEDIVRSDEEIERKYLLSGPPSLPEGAESAEIEQGYLPTRRIEERLRRAESRGRTRLLRTWKIGQGLRRLQIDEEVEPEAFEALWPLTEGRRIRKRRHVVREGDDVWELDEFLDRELWLAEIEFDDPDREIVLPAWLAPHVVRDVTDEGSYGNRKLAM